MVNVIIIRAHQVKMDPRVRMEADILNKAGYEVNILFWNTKNEKYPSHIGGVPLVEISNKGIMKFIKHESLKFHFFWKEGVKLINKIIRENKKVILHCFDFPTLPICAKIKKNYQNVIVIYDAADIWEYMVYSEIPTLLLNYHLYLEKRYIKYVDFLITPGETYTKYYFRKYNFPRDKSGIIMNAKPLFKDRYIPPHNDKPTLLYIGVLKNNRKILELLDVIPDFPEITLRIGGVGPLYDIVRKVANNYDNVEFLGTVPHEKVLDLTFKSDAIYAMFDNQHPLTKIGFPNKFFEAVSTGRAIITSKGTFLGDIVEKLGIGLVVEPNKDGIREALERIKHNRNILEEMGKKAIEWGIKKYNKKYEAKKLLKIYSELLNLQK